MGFLHLDDVATALKETLSGGIPELGGNVACVAATSVEQLLAAVRDAFKNPPCAVVCVGAVDYPYHEHCAKREISAIIALADAYKSTSSDKAAGVWGLVRSAEDLFAPGDREIGGGTWRLVSASPVSLDSRMSLFMLVVKGVEFL